MRAAIHVVKINPPIRQSMDKISCQAGTPNGSNAGITTGELNGMSDAQNASEDLGC